MQDMSFAATEVAFWEECFAAPFAAAKFESSDTGSDMTVIESSTK